jgi:hypothetical protein
MSIIATLSLHSQYWSDISLKDSLRVHAGIVLNDEIHLITNRYVSSHSKNQRVKAQHISSKTNSISWNYDTIHYPFSDYSPSFVGSLKYHNGVFYYPVTDGYFLFRQEHSDSTNIVKGKQLVRNADLIDLAQIGNYLFTTSGNHCFRYDILQDSMYKSNYIDGGWLDSRFYTYNGILYFLKSGDSRFIQETDAEYCDLHLSLDSGITFSHLLQSNDSIGLRTLAFKSNELFGAGHNGKVYSSPDSGKSWRFECQIPEAQINDILFVNDSLGYAVGGSRPFRHFYYRLSWDTTGFIYQTTDGGKKWNKVLKTTGSLLRLLSVNDTMTIAFGAHGKVFSTNNIPHPLKLSEPNREQLFKIYPNPFFEEIKLYSPSTAFISITSIDGHIVYRATVRENQELPIDTSDWPNGSYLVNISDREGRQIVKKIVK